MVTNMLYGGPFRDMRLLQEEVNRLAQSAAAPQATFPAINVYAHQDAIIESVVVALSSAPSDFRFRLIPTKWMQS